MTLMLEDVDVSFKGLIPDNYVEEINQLLKKHELDACVSNKDVTTVEGYCYTYTFESAFIELMELVNRICKETGIEAEGRITYSGDYKGAYVLTESGKSFEDVNSTVLAVMDSETDVLIKELKKRGYIVLEVVEAA